MARTGLTTALGALTLPIALTSASADAPLTLSCKQGNDLYRALKGSGLRAPRFDSPTEAIDAATPGSGVLVLADDYPASGPVITETLVDLVQAKGLRLYVEFPSALPGMEPSEPVGTVWERAVVSSDFFGPDLPKLTILAIHGCRYVPLEAGSPSLVVARVAGYDTAVYGLPETARPLLAEWPEANALVATTALSNFITGRYGPERAWGIIWGRILAWLAPDADLPELRWKPTFRPTYTVDEPLPAGAQRRALRRGARWFQSSRLLIDDSWAEEFAAEALGAEQGTLDPRRAVGDGSLGMMEGFSAHVAYDGTQPERLVVRNDCVAESAMALAFDGAVDGERRSARSAANLADFICFDSLIQGGIRADPKHPCFGLMSWGTTSYAWERAFYGDDNARALLGLIAVSALQDETRWEESILRALLANLRTTGALGFRGNRIDIPELEANGWRAYHEREIINYASHYESYLWACYLWAYRATGHREFLDKAENAIRMTIGAGEGEWRWTNGVIQERARILLCLSWLVRIDDTPEHREWLLAVARDVLRNQVECGAIREELGDPERAQFGAVPSNEAYGTAETPLIQENGDPACDLLYTTNFAFLGLHEAAAATGDPELKAAEDRLADFLCRIQVRSEEHPELDGAWCRAFDFEKWEHWGSSADLGWGAWSIESGWTQGWITAVLALREMDTSLWELTAGVDLRDEMPGVQRLMAVNDGGPYVPEPSPAEHAAVGAAYTLDPEPHEGYPSAPGQLTDGLAWPATSHGKYAGWFGPDMVATVDLGEVRWVNQAGGIFMRNSDIGIFLPTEVEASASIDGEEFVSVATKTAPPHRPGDRIVDRREIVAVGDPVQARYVRIHAKSLGMMPNWHPTHDTNAWLFCDELVVR